jgi:hypothetical protein
LKELEVLETTLALANLVLITEVWFIAIWLYRLPKRIKVAR